MGNKKNKFRSNLKSEIISTLHPFLERQAEFAYLFGSSVSGALRPDSDVDVGIFFKPEFSDFNLRLRFSTEVADALGREADIVSLNECDTIIAMQIIANGELIFNYNGAERLGFVLRTLSQYPDLKLTRKVVEDNLMKGGLYD
jgi:predicted nucleotidyltransferase